MTTPQQRTWMNELRDLFPVFEEFEIASKVYWFEVAYDVGLSPQQAYDDFDKHVAGEVVS